MQGSRRAVLWLAALGLVSCGDEGPDYDEECISMWEQAESCWRSYCEEGGNRLFCSCIAGGRSLSGVDCQCSGSARQEFLGACTDREPPDAKFDCEAEIARIEIIDARSQCCADSGDCGSGERCVESKCAP